MKAIVLCLVLAGCGAKETEIPGLKSLGLEDAVRRVESKLLWSCDLPTEPNRKDCSGDAMSMGGRWLLDGGPDTKVWEAMKASIGPSGRPYRAPDRVGVQTENSFSRDQLIGLVEGTVAMGDIAPLWKVWRFAQEIGQLCIDADNERCRVTPSVSILVRDTLGLKVSELERRADEVTVTAEASAAPPTYQAYLVARKIRLKGAQGKLTEGYCRASKVLLSRYPKNLFFRVVGAQCGRGSFVDIADELTGCLQNWKGPGKEWAWNGGNAPCYSPASGHELVALGKYLTSTRAFYLMTR